jgi:hypothetical protein
VIFTGDGDKAFSAGADINEVAQRTVAGELFHQGAAAPRAAAPHRIDAPADHRRHQRLLPRRGPRARARLHAAHRGRGRDARAAGDQPGRHPGQRRHAAPRAHGGRGPRDGAGDARRADRRAGGLPHRPGESRLCAAELLAVRMDICAQVAGERAGVPHGRARRGAAGAPTSTWPRASTTRTSSSRWRSQAASADEGVAAFREKRKPKFRWPRPPRRWRGFVSALRYEDLPPAVVDAARRHLPRHRSAWPSVDARTRMR